MLSSRTKHVLHCALLFAVITLFEVYTGGLKFQNDNASVINPWEEYGFLPSVLLYVLRLLAFLPLPQVLLNFAGLVFYNAFPDKVVLKSSPLLAPFLCIRIVTRGDYPQLVKNNVSRNLSKCLETGLENFVVEVVTDKPLNLVKDRRVIETVVPNNYKTKSGALFKARALQYCLEEGVNTLSDNDWIVHLDEETLLTENSIRGILNFVNDGKHPFGQGLITYANEEVVNWITTLADTFRVADDMGKLRFQFLKFHKPLLSWKGSYVITQVRTLLPVCFIVYCNDIFFFMAFYILGESRERCFLR